jgi:DnaJ like chaperone protein
LSAAGTRQSSIWSRIAGAVGAAPGGPLGALADLVGRIRGAGSPPDGDRTRSIAFTIAVVALGAKMAKADGAVTDTEIAAFEQVFHVPREEAGNVARVFALARRSAAGFEHYARQVAGMFRDRPEVLEELLQCLFHIAKSDGAVTPEELSYLRTVSDLFGLPRRDFDRLTTEECVGCDVDPYGVLGVDFTIDEEGLRTAYRRLALRYHPDRLVAEGLPVEFVTVATEKMKSINAAHDRIRRDRGWRPAEAPASED